jgi:IS30 family transposase
MVLKASGCGVRAIGREIGRDASTVSRELRRNGLKESYSADAASKKYRTRRRGNLRILNKNKRLLSYVHGKLKKKRWSPEQISGRLRKMFGKDSENYVSHETIYASIYALPKGELRKDLIAALRQSHKTRKPRTRGKDRRGQIQDIVSIHERPQEVRDRLMPGHWEGDLIKGKGNKSSIGTVVERMSRFLIMVQLDDATSPVVTGGFEREMKPIAPSLLKSLTYDRGKEMSNHKALSLALQLDVYFADPHAPWQRGTNENTNGLIRQFLPKGSDLSPFSQAELNEIAELLNGRPRKCLGFRTPKEVFRDITKNAMQSINVAPQL